MIFIPFSGICRQVGLNLTVPNGTKTIDATGKLVMPGEIGREIHFISNDYEIFRWNRYAYTFRITVHGYCLC